MVSSTVIEAVDLFCGAGGLTHGLLGVGIAVKAGIDVEPECRFAYEKNNPGARFIEASVESVAREDVLRLYGDHSMRLLCGCAPCQTFSTMNQKDEALRRKSVRWRLLDEFGRLVESVGPDLVSMENVPGLMKQDVFARFTETLERLNYCVDYAVLDCSDFGMPQRRERLVLVASRLGHIALPTPPLKNALDTRATVRAAIGSLPALKAGESNEDDPLHVAANLSAKNLKRIRASKPGGTWRDWDADLVSDCHKVTSGDGYSAVYGRMCWDEPAPTITTQFYNYGSGRFGHPSQDRALSLREGALLQGFPADYAFCSSDNPIGKRKLGMLIGNAVPVGLGRLVGKTLIQHVSSIAQEKSA